MSKVRLQERDADEYFANRSIKKEIISDTIKSIIEDERSRNFSSTDVLDVGISLFINSFNLYAIYHKMNEKEKELMVDNIIEAVKLKMNEVKND